MPRAMGDGETGEQHTDNKPLKGQTQIQRAVTGLVRWVSGQSIRCISEKEPEFDPRTTGWKERSDAPTELASDLHTILRPVNTHVQKCLRCNTNSKDDDYTKSALK